MPTQAANFQEKSTNFFDSSIPLLTGWGTRFQITTKVCSFTPWTGVSSIALSQANELSRTARG